jgi:hypothetical protein
MTHDLPAMRRFKDALRQIATYGGLLAREGQVIKLAPELVADVEAEGNALIGAEHCAFPRPHGDETPDGDIEPGLWLKLSACPGCGGAL